MVPKMMTLKPTSTLSGSSSQPIGQYQQIQRSQQPTAAAEPPGEHTTEGVPEDSHGDGGQGQGGDKGREGRGRGRGGAKTQAEEERKRKLAAVNHAPARVIHLKGAVVVSRKG